MKRWLLNSKTSVNCGCIVPAGLLDFVLQGTSAKAPSELGTALQCFLNGTAFFPCCPAHLYFACWLNCKENYVKNTLYWFCTFPNCLPVQLNLSMCSLVCSPNSNTKSHVPCYHSGWALMEYLFHFSDYPNVFWTHLHPLCLNSNSLCRLEMHCL